MNQSQWITDDENRVLGLRDMVLRAAKDSDDRAKKEYDDRVARNAREVTEEIAVSEVVRQVILAVAVRTAVPLTSVTRRFDAGDDLALRSGLGRYYIARWKEDAVWMQVARSGITVGGKGISRPCTSVDDAVNYIEGLLK